MRWYWWTGTVLIGASLLFWFLVKDVQPQSVPKIKLSPFATPMVAANAVALRLQEELKATPVWLWGLNPSDQFQREVLKNFVTSPPGNFPPFEEIWVDQETALDPQFFAPHQIQVKVIAFKEDWRQVLAASDQRRRILVVTASPYAASFLSGGPAWQLTQGETKPWFYSLIFADFPRQRDQEASMSFPCVLPHADATGTGDLGCRILQKARSLYRKALKPGGYVGTMDQVSGRDFLFLLAVEP
jgi:hypothetical protein